MKIFKKCHKKSIIFIIVLLLSFIFFSIMVLEINVDENMISSYAAAFATLDQNKGMKKDELLEKAENYLKIKYSCRTNELFVYFVDYVYRIDKLPVIYHSIDELKNGIEESLMILSDYEILIEDKNELDMDGYTIDDFYQMLNARIDAEKLLLEKLNGDSEPDLFDYSLDLYLVREKYPVIY